jgi:hypothetical protein
MIRRGPVRAEASRERPQVRGRNRDPSRFGKFDHHPPPAFKLDEPPFLARLIHQQRPQLGEFDPGRLGRP